MNITKRLYNHQYGLKVPSDYDFAIARLRCYKDNHYTTILQSDQTDSDTPIFACKFAHGSNPSLVALANEDGKLAIHDTARTERYGARVHNNAIFDLSWTFGDTQLVTASGDHTARLFDVSNCDVREIKTFYGHSRSVKTVTFRKDDSSVFASGGRDGHIIVWDTRTDVGSFIGKVDRMIFNSHSTKVAPCKTRKRFAPSSPSTASGAKSVTGLAFQNDNTLVSCGAGDGVIKIWDLRKNYMFSQSKPIAKDNIPYSGTTTKNGFSNLVIDQQALKLYANCLDSTIYCYDLNTCSPKPLQRFTGHQNCTFYIKSVLSRDGAYLVSGSSDENAYIWNTSGDGKPLVKLTGHTAEVTCVAWSEHCDTTLVTCSDDMSHKFWTVGPEEKPDNWEILGRGCAEVVPPKPVLDLHPLKDQRDVQVIVNMTISSKRKYSSDEAEDFQPVTKRAREAPRSYFSGLPPARLQTVHEHTSPPTKNLPNYVVDGLAPHLHFSPPKPKVRDWLTNLRFERKIRQGVADVAASLPSTSGLGSPKPVAKLDFSPKRTPKSPLLRFFKVKCESRVYLTKNGCTTCVASSTSQPSQ